MTQSISTALRALVRERAHFRFEYCLLHEDDSFFPHEINHIVATKHRGESKESYLAWSCFDCNRHKGSDMTSVDMETGLVVQLFNSCVNSWPTHFKLVAGTIVPLDSIGRVTEYLLRLNEPSRVNDRYRLFNAGLYPR
jgi:hypothetical protein